MQIIKSEYIKVSMCLSKTSLSCTKILVLKTTSSNQICVHDDDVLDRHIETLIIAGRGFNF